MVGVPGRSRACQPCKKRRVACDLQQPACTRCVKARRKCEYGSGRIFVLNDEGSHKTKYRKSDAILASPKDNPRDSSSPIGIPGSEAIPPAKPLLLYQKPSDGILSQQALLAHALDGDLAYNTPALGFLACSASASIATPCLRASFLACYMGWIGRRDHDTRLVDAGHQFYVEALKDTHLALVKSETACDDSTLAACSALGIYEALECPGGTKMAYLCHRDACNRLIRMRGPEAHQTGPAHRLFVNFRFFGILHALDNGIDTYLSHPNWTHIPFTTHTKTKFDELIDIFTLGPETSRIGKSLGTLPPDRLFPVALSLLEKLAVIKEKLRVFYENLLADSAEGQQQQQPLWWERVSPTREDLAPQTQGEEDADFVFPPTIWFHDMETAGILTLYWAILAMVWSGLIDLYNMFAEHDLEPLFLAAMGGEAQAHEYEPERMAFLCLDRSRKVLQSLAFCTTREALRLGPPRGMAQLAIVSEVLKARKGCEAEYRWARKARKRIGMQWLKLLDARDW